MARKCMIIALVLTYGLLTHIVGFANAQTPAGPMLMPGPAVSNAHTPAGGAVPKGSMGLNTGYVWAEKEHVWIGGERFRAHNDATFNLLALKPRVGLGNGWDIRAAIPFIANDFTQTPSRNGLGDIIVIVRKQLFAQKDGFPFSMAAGLGVQAPTGSTSYDGVGSGAWDLYAELGFTYAFNNNRQVLEFGIGYSLAGEGDAEAKLANGRVVQFDNINQNDGLTMHARWAMALHKNWDIGIEAQYEQVFESSRNGRGRNDNNVSIFAGPAVRFKIPEWKLSLGISPQFALYRDFENALVSGTGPAGECFRLEASLLKLF